MKKRFNTLAAIALLTCAACTACGPRQVNNENNPPTTGKVSPTLAVNPGNNDYTPTPIGGVIDILPTDVPITGAGVDPNEVIGKIPENAIIPEDDNAELTSFAVDVETLTKESTVKVNLVPYVGVTLNPALSEDIDACVQKKLASVKEEVFIEDSARYGDYVNVNYYCNVLDESGEYEDAYSETGISARLGSGEMIYGFENAILGNRQDDVVSFTYTYPADYEDDRFAGKTAVFYININYVYRIVTPDLTTETVSTYFGYETVADFVYACVQETNRLQYESQVWDYINNNVTVENLPEWEVIEYSETLYNRYMNYAYAYAYQYDNDVNKSLSVLVNGAVSSEEELRDYTRSIARQTLTELYILKAITKNNEADINEEVFEARRDKYITATVSQDSLIPFEYNDYEVYLGVYKDIAMEYIIAHAIIEQ